MDKAGEDDSGGRGRDRRRRHGGVGLVGSQVTVTLEVEAEIQSGVSESVVRTVTENSRTLKFVSQGFEAE
jgi:hypothetical protein